MLFIHSASICLDDTNLVSNIQGIVILGELNVGLFKSVGSNKSVDLGGVDIVQSLNSLLDLVFVGAEVNDEDESVVIFDVLHGAFRSKGILHNGILRENVRRNAVMNESSGF